MHFEKHVLELEKPVSVRTDGCPSMTGFVSLLKKHFQKSNMLSRELRIKFDEDFRDVIKMWSKLSTTFELDSSRIFLSN
jgi:hypothetical protein